MALKMIFFLLSFMTNYKTWRTVPANCVCLYPLGCFMQSTPDFMKSLARLFFDGLKFRMFRSLRVNFKGTLLGTIVGAQHVANNMILKVGLSQLVEHSPPIKNEIHSSCLWSKVLTLKGEGRTSCRWYCPLALKQPCQAGKMPPNLRSTCPLFCSSYGYPKERGYRFWRLWVLHIGVEVAYRHIGILSKEWLAWLFRAILHPLQLQFVTILRMKKKETW